MTDKARTDGERRTALFGQMVVAADGGKLDQALAELQKQYALGEKSNDVPAMAADLQLKGNILLEMGKYPEAKQAYEQALKMTNDSSLSKEIKDNTALFHHFNLARVAIGQQDLQTAKERDRRISQGSRSGQKFRPDKTSTRVSRQDCVAGKELRPGNSRIRSKQFAEPC
jgi:tetratricopeptide (TPR) repeat protein